MNLIFDRTSSDVERWRTLRDKGWSGMTESERKEWVGEITPTPCATKGMYTHVDLNRVESAVRVLSDRLREMGYDHPELTVKTDWKASENFWREDMARYLNNVRVIRNSIAVYPTTPQVPTVGVQFSHLKANDVERILNDVDEITNNIVKSRFYAGDIISGEV